MSWPEAFTYSVAVVCSTCIVIAVVDHLFQK
jgi:hypothetical protein